jgi:hydroxymethylbilane synthase
LALVQAGLVQDALQKAWPGLEVIIVPIRTAGDEASRLEKPTPWGQGIFTQELERALSEQKIDVAVHSLKDMPTETNALFALGAVPRREDARDALVSRGPRALAELPPGATVAAGCPRRRAQLAWKRPDLQLRDIRGNVDTRLRKFRESNWDGMVLAQAGLNRLQPDLAGLSIGTLRWEEMLCAPGQGALGLQVRSDDREMRESLVALHDVETAQATQAERAFLQALGGGCQLPVGSYAEVLNGGMRVRGIAWLEGDLTPREGQQEGKAEQAMELGLALAEQLQQARA